MHSIIRQSKERHARDNVLQTSPAHFKTLKRSNRAKGQGREQLFHLRRLHSAHPTTVLVCHTTFPEKRSSVALFDFHDSTP